MNKIDYNNNRKAYRNKYYIRPKDVETYLFQKHKDGSIHIYINDKYYGYTLDDIYARHILVQLSDEFDDCEVCMVLIKDIPDL